jgi:hypothetical protein
LRDNALASCRRIHTRSTLIIVPRLLREPFLDTDRNRRFAVFRETPETMAYFVDRIANDVNMYPIKRREQENDDGRQEAHQAGCEVRPQTW